MILPNLTFGIAIIFTFDRRGELFRNDNLFPFVWGGEAEFLRRAVIWGRKDRFLVVLVIAEHAINEFKLPCLNRSNDHILINLQGVFGHNYTKVS
jgi:hypothetical protein